MHSKMHTNIPHNGGVQKSLQNLPLLFSSIVAHLHMISYNKDYLHLEAYNKLCIYSQYKSLDEGVFRFDDLVTRIDQGS